MATQILMPALSPTMEEGTLAKWHVKAGDTVSSGDILAEIETDKATMEFEAVDEGVIGKILVPEGSEGVKVRAPIAILLEEGEDPDAGLASIETHAPTAPASAEKAASPASAPEKNQAETQVAASQAVLGPTTKHATDRIFASPLAKRIAAEKGIDLSTVTGSGPRGRIVKADVETLTGSPVAAKSAAVSGTIPAAPAPQGQPAPSALPNAKLFFKEDEYEVVPNDMMRKAIARRLSAAASIIPHVAFSIECELDALLAIRKQMNAASPKEDGYKVSVNDFVIKASAMALKDVPEINASWTDEAILRHKHADIGVAVALPTGLITPIVKHAEEKGLKEISAEVKELVTKARNKKLKPEEFEGGTFSVSNLGMYGVKSFNSIINPPQAAILSVGAGELTPVVKAGQIAVAMVMTVTLSLDHRVTDGATGGRFLQAFRRYIEQPAMMLL